MTEIADASVVQTGVKSKEIPSAELLHKLLHYNPETGLLTWKPRTVDDFSNPRQFQAWKASTFNPEAGRGVLKADGRKCYKQLCINGTKYLVQRIVWTMFRGPIPDGYWIDHIDRDKWNNRIENLRLCDASQSSANRGRPKSRLKGLPRGVGPVTGGYTSNISVRGKRIYLGFFRTPEEAGKAYENAAKKYHGEFACVE
jgi:hypothetical protein